MTLLPISFGDVYRVVKRNGANISDRSTKRLRWQIPIFLLICGVSYLWTTYVRGGDDSRPPVIQLEPTINVSQKVSRRRLHQLNKSDPDNCLGTCQSYFEGQREKKISGEFVLINAKSMLRYKDDCLPEDADYEKLLDSPTALAVIKDEKMAWIIWYIFGILYMFAGLAIVCDEFFVPALECFVDEFGISMDVAGATFMAAGGSMPELFTSFIATFQETEIGFVAIVGSAVFNVLFVIAVCAIASPEVLPLTWWPLARDCTFYVIALLTVAFVFTVNTRNQIDAWEACLLLCEYIMYCTFMKFNSRVNIWIEEKITRVRKKTASVTPEASEGAGPAAGEDGEGDMEPFTTASQRVAQNPQFNKPSTFRVGIVQILTKNTYLYETAGIAAVTQIQGEVEETFKRLDKNNDGTLNAEEIKQLLIMLGNKKSTLDNASIKTAMRRINRTGDDQVTLESFKKWYISSETRVQAEVNKVFDQFDKDENGYIDANEIEACLQSLNHKPSREDMIRTIDELKQFIKDHPEKRSSEDGSKRMDEGDAASPAAPDVTPVHEFGSDQLKDSLEGFKLSLEQFSEWYFSSLFYHKKRDHHAAEEDALENGYLTLDWPEEPGKIALFWYIFTYPLCAVLYCTLPDVRHPKYRERTAGTYKVAILEFALCLIWIALMSNWLYECLVVVSNTLKIPVAVSAVTLLAGGTSVPDLLSSYVVAKNKEGDMAVSSSIGSNIFDVTVGLPLPWLCYNIAKGKAFDLGEDGSKGIGFNILLLIGMLGAVIGTTMWMHWRMTKAMGYMMLVFYLIYVIQYLLVKMPDKCPPAADGVFQIDF